MPCSVRVVVAAPDASPTLALPPTVSLAPVDAGSSPSPLDDADCPGPELLLGPASALLPATAADPLLDDTASARAISGLPPADVGSSPTLDVEAGVMSVDTGLVDSGRSTPVLLRTPRSLVD